MRAAGPLGRGQSDLPARRMISGNATGEERSVTTVSVRYIVADVDAAISFYRDQLGFDVVMHPAPSFGMLARGDLRLLLSAPSGVGGGGQAMPDGTTPQPGGWNRFMLDVDDLESVVAALQAAGVRLRSGILHGVGGDQVIVEDPSGNPVELFAAKREAARPERS